MRRSVDRFAQIRRRLEAIHAATLTPARKREAWAKYLEDGILPADPALRNLVEHLRNAEIEFDQIHQPAPVAGQE